MWRKSLTAWVHRHSQLASVALSDRSESNAIPSMQRARPPEAVTLSGFCSWCVVLMVIFMKLYMNKYIRKSIIWAFSQELWYLWASHKFDSYVCILFVLLSVWNLHFKLDFTSYHWHALLYKIITFLLLFQHLATAIFKSSLKKCFLSQ